MQLDMFLSHIQNTEERVERKQSLSCRETFLKPTYSLNLVNKVNIISG